MTPEDLEGWVVEVGVALGDGFERRGSGFVVAPNVVLTCEHVLTGKDSDRPADGEVRVRIGGGRPLTPVRAVRGRASEVHEDRALLHLADAGPCLPLLRPYGPDAHVPALTFACGYPGTDRPYSYVPFGRLKLGEVTENRVMRLTADNEVSPGLSGGPLVAATRDGFVVLGMSQWGGTAHDVPSFAASGLLSEWLRGVPGVVWKSPEETSFDESWARLQLMDALSRARSKALLDGLNASPQLKARDNTAEAVASALLAVARVDLARALAFVWAVSARARPKQDVAEVLLVAASAARVGLDGVVSSSSELATDVAQARRERSGPSIEWVGGTPYATLATAMPRNLIDPREAKTNFAVLWAELIKLRKAAGRPILDWMATASAFEAHVYNNHELALIAEGNPFATPARRNYVLDRGAGFTAGEVAILDRAGFDYVREVPCAPGPQDARVVDYLKRISAQLQEEEPPRV